MVTTTPEAGSSAAAPEDGGRTFSKLRQIGTDLMTATGNGECFEWKSRDEMSANAIEARNYITVITNLFRGFVDVVIRDLCRT